MVWGREEKEKVNGEKYSDPTADKAIRNVNTPPEDISLLVRMMKSMASIAGYEIAERIVFRDRETGKEWR